MAQSWPFFVQGTYFSFKIMFTYGIIFSPIFFEIFNALFHESIVKSDQKSIHIFLEVRSNCKTGACFSLWNPFSSKQQNFGRLKCYTSRTKTVRSNCQILVINSGVSLSWNRYKFFSMPCNFSFGTNIFKLSKRIKADQ